MSAIKEHALTSVPVLLKFYGLYFACEKFASRKIKIFISICFSFDVYLRDFSSAAI